MSRPSRRILSDLHGHLDPATVEDDEIAIVLSDAARIGLLKLIGKQSRIALAAAGLTDNENDAVDELFHKLT